MPKEVQDLPSSGDVYLQRENCTQEQVNAFIRLGYTPWQITPVTEMIQGRMGITSFTTKLVYHFVRKKVKE